MFSRISLVLVCVVVLAASASAALQVSKPVYKDSFSDSVTDKKAWNVLTPFVHGYGPWAQEKNGRLEVTIPSYSREKPEIDSFSAGYESLWKLRGDFDVQVDYKQIEWPSENGVRIGISVVCPKGEWLSCERTTLGKSEVPGQPHDFYVCDYGKFGAGKSVVTKDKTGKLRFVRTGQTLVGYFLNNGKWQYLYAAAIPRGDVRVAISAWSHNYAFTTEEVKMAFDEFQVNFGQMIWPENK